MDKLKALSMEVFQRDCFYGANTLMLVYEDIPGMISKVTALIQEKNINIASLHCDRYAKGEEASMCICIDGDIDADVIEAVKKIEKVYFVSYIKKLED